MLEEGEGGFDFRGVRGNAVGPEALALAEFFHDGPAVGGEADEFGAFVIGIWFELNEHFLCQTVG